MASKDLVFRCVLWLACSGSLWAFVANDANQVVTIGGQCNCEALYMPTSAFPTWMWNQSVYLLPDNHTYNFFVTGRNFDFEMATFSPGENLTGTQFDPSKPTLIIVHAFTDFAFDVPYLYILKEYLNLVDGNVILLDWFLGSFALNNYPQSIANAEGAACQVAILIKNLVNDRGYNIKNFHLTGWSLGGQTVGLIGKQVQTLTGQKVARISPLDPAGEWFITQTNPAHYVTKGDADFVDVIHAAGEQTGILQVSFGEINYVGDVDFYPDGGRVQSVCPSSIGIFNDLNLLCAHITAPFFFGYSINGPCNYTSCACASLPDASSTSTDWNQCLTSCSDSSVMGYHSISKSGRGPQYLSISTNNVECTTVFSLFKVNTLINFISAANQGLLVLLHLYGYTLTLTAFSQTAIGQIVNKFASQLPPAVLANLSLPFPLLG